MVFYGVLVTDERNHVRLVVDPFEFGSLTVWSFRQVLECAALGGGGGTVPSLSVLSYLFPITLLDRMLASANLKESRMVPRRDPSRSFVC